MSGAGCGGHPARPVGGWPYHLEVSLSRAEVRHVARLARLGITAEEEEFYARQLSGILDHINRLAELDTSQVPPTAQVIPMESVMRADEALPPPGQGPVLANAPVAENGFFVVDAILEADD